MVAARNKPNISVSLSPYLIMRAREMVDSEEFGSVSDALSTAFAQFILRYDCEINDKHLPNLIQEYLSSPEGESLIRSILRKSLTANEEKSAATSIIEKQ